MFSGIAVVALTAQALTGSPRLSEPSARDLYVGCALQLRGDELKQAIVLDNIKGHSAASCLLVEAQLLALAKQEDDGSALKFCPHGSANFDLKPFDAMSTAYVEFFEANANAVSGVSGRSAMLLAVKKRWPCK